MINSLRFRLTAWYLAFFSLLFAGFSIFLYHVVANSLERRLDESLISQAGTAAGLFQEEFAELAGDAQRAAAEAVAGIRQHGGIIALFAGDRLLAASSPVAPGEFAAALAAAAGPRVVSLPRSGKHGARAATHPVAAGGKDYLAIAAAPLDSIMENLAVVRAVLLFAMPGLLAIAAIGGYLLTTRSLAPLKWMAQQAHQIGGSNLGARLDIGDAVEELGSLSASFNELLARLDQSFESMSRFVADASHELRTPLAVIRGEAEVALAHERRPVEYQESLAIILDESRRLSRLIDDLLNLARADAGRVKLRVEEFYLNDMLAECCGKLQPLASTRGIALDCQCPGDIAFRGDEQLLHRLIVNLLDNAIRYTPRGGKVSASLECESGGVRLRIADNGIGIASEAVPHVFDRFYRTDQARSREAGGFGLGLSIVKWIAESHHGAVSLDSRPAAGSTFTVTLPR